MPHPPNAEDPLVLECAGCGADFLASPAIPVDAILCPSCATIQPCGHRGADLMEDAAGNSVCARCLEERG